MNVSHTFQLKNVGVHGHRLVMTEVADLDSLRVWNSPDVLQIRGAFEQSQRLLEKVKGMDQQYQDQSDKVGEVAVLNSYETLRTLQWNYALAEM